MVELMTENTNSNPKDRGAEVIDRIIRRGERAAALGADSGHGHQNFDGDQFDLEERAALRRVAGLSTERQDISDVEYRQLRLEKVIVIGLWGQQTLL
jgi:GTP-binding protein HflX